jgi:hypothetical protein
MKIPVFVSCPTLLNREQEAARKFLVEQLESFNLEARSLGRSDYPREFPLREVLVLARHCSGGVILGFSVFEASSGVWGKGTENEHAIQGNAHFPTAWNQLEAGILFSLGLPLLIFREPGINGGVFDNGVTDVFIHEMPNHLVSEHERSVLRDVLLKWHTAVSNHYYQI